MRSSESSETGKDSTNCNLIQSNRIYTMSDAMIRKNTHSIWKTPVTMTLCTPAAVVLVVLLIHGRARFNGLRAGTQQRSFHICRSVAPTWYQCSEQKEHTFKESNPTYWPPASSQLPWRSLARKLQLLNDIHRRWVSNVFLHIYLKIIFVWFH